MNGLLSFQNFAVNPVEAVSREILALNDISEEHGLVLTPEDAMELAETRAQALTDNERLEIGVGAIGEIIRYFSRSRYVNQEDYSYLLNEITEIFYYIKTETNDKISDDALLRELFRRFELNCRGSVDILVSREAERLIRKINSGENYARWFGETDGILDNADRDTPENALRDEYDNELWSEDENDYIFDESYDEDEDIDAELDSFDDYLDALARGEIAEDEDEEEEDDDD